jgi:hypothetical protein
MSLDRINRHVLGNHIAETARVGNRPFRRTPHQSTCIMSAVSPPLMPLLGSFETELRINPPEMNGRRFRVPRMEHSLHLVGHRYNEGHTEVIGGFRKQ